MVAQNLLSPLWLGGGQQPNRPARSRPLHYRVRPLGGATALPAPCGAAAPAPGTERPPAPLQWGGVFIVGVSWLMAPWEGYRAPKSGAALPLLLPPVGIVAVLALPFDAAVIGLGMLSPSAGWAHPKVAPSIPRTARCFSAVSPPVLLNHPPVPVCHSPFPFCHPLVPLCHPPTPTCPPPPPSPCATLSLPSGTQTLGDTHLPGPEGPPPRCSHPGWAQGILLALLLQSPSLWGSPCCKDSTTRHPRSTSSHWVPA